MNNEAILLALAKNLSKAREENEMKQDIAAKALQISRSTLSKYENGDLRGLTIDGLLAMSKLYNKPLLELLPNEPGITFIFNPTNGVHNQQAYNIHSQTEGYRELVTHLQEEIKFLRNKLNIK